MAYAQDKRIAALKPPSGLDGLVLRSFTTTEGISQLFEVRVQAVSKDKANLDLGKALGQMGTVTLETYGKKRFFAGMLADARHDGDVTGGHGYVLVLRPPVWFLSKRINSRVFQQKTVTDVIDAILAENNVDHQMKTQGSFPQLEYVVQHRESDLAFVLRLMEAHGIRYHFEFAEQTCTMVLSNGSPQDLPDGNKRTFIVVSDKNPRKDEFLTEWSPQRHFTAAKVKTNDYNFLTSTTDLKSEKQATVPFDKKLEEYEQLYEQHLGKETAAGKGQDYAQIRLDMRRTEDERHVAIGDAARLTPGYVMELEKHPDFSGRYLIVRCTHHFSGQAYVSGGGAGEETEYGGIYEMMPEAQQFRPPMITPRPLISGVQTGLVLGGENDDKDIDVDEYGRILVHMHWNTEGNTKPEGQTMRCRVLQSWAGSNWGTMFIPRKGMEVLVQYVDGDPDRPVVIGCVYNDKHKPPYPLEGKKNLAGWKSRSTEGGGEDDYNEFVFDDTKGSELVRFNAQKDLESTIENSEKRTIKASDRTTVLEQGNDSLKAELGKIHVEAAQEIKLTVGQSIITLKPEGITIEALTIKIKATISLDTQAVMATHKGDAMMTIKGGIVMIN
jgi:type VI secretion system secreted protein VgrG